VDLRLAFVDTLFRWRSSTQERTAAVQSLQRAGLEEATGCIGLLKQWDGTLGADSEKVRGTYPKWIHAVHPPSHFTCPQNFRASVFQWQEKVEKLAEEVPYLPPTHLLRIIYTPSVSIYAIHSRTPQVEKRRGGTFYDEVSKEEKKQV
jgi:hypothetical protein